VCKLPIEVEVAAPSPWFPPKTEKTHTWKRGECSLPMQLVTIMEHTAAAVERDFHRPQFDFLGWFSPKLFVIIIFRTMALGAGRPESRRTTRAMSISFGVVQRCQLDCFGGWPWAWEWAFALRQ
jgi:hypothetical protein